MCDCLQQVMDKMGCDLPFEQPLYLEPATHEWKVHKWAVKLMKRTPSGGVSKRGQRMLFLNFCPICGKAFEEKDNGK